MIPYSSARGLTKCCCSWWEEHRIHSYRITSSIKWQFFPALLWTIKLHHYYAASPFIAKQQLLKHWILAGLENLRYIHMWKYDLYHVLKNYMFAFILSFWNMVIYDLITQRTLVPFEVHSASLDKLRDAVMQTTIMQCVFFILLLFAVDFIVFGVPPEHLLHAITQVKRTLFGGGEM